MNTKHTTTPKLFHEDEFRLIINKYNNMDISTSRLCEIINGKADKIVSLNSELLESLKDILSLCKFRYSETDEDAFEKMANAYQVIKKATE